MLPAAPRQPLGLSEYPLEGAPHWVVGIAHAFPLFHIVNAFDACFVPQTTGGGWSGSDLAAIAAWGLLGLAVAARRLRSEPVAGDRAPCRGLPRRHAAAA